MNRRRSSGVSSAMFVTALSQFHMSDLSGRPVLGFEDDKSDEVRYAGRLFPILPFDDSPRQHRDAVCSVLDGLDLSTCPQVSADWDR